MTADLAFAEPARTAARLGYRRASMRSRSPTAFASAAARRSRPPRREPRARPRARGSRRGGLDDGEQGERVSRSPRHPGDLSLSHVAL